MYTKHYTNNLCNALDIFITNSYSTFYAMIKSLFISETQLKMYF